MTEPRPPRPGALRAALALALALAGAFVGTVV